MNVFRLTGDLSHLLAILALLWKIWKTRSCAGKFFQLCFVRPLMAPILMGNCFSDVLPKDISTTGVSMLVFVLVSSLAVA